MRFRILGSVEVLTALGWQGIGAAKWRNLLSVLLLNPETVIATDQLIGELWPENVPSGARKLVNLYVLRLRRLIGDSRGEVLVTRAPGYLLQLEHNDLDAQRFESLVADARGEWAHGNPEGAGALLAAALDLWRGSALSDVTAPSALLGARRLEESRISALLQRVEADLACSRHAEVVGELRDLVIRHPLREQFWDQLIRALKGAGRGAEALQAYEQARQVIADELGSDPGQELQALHQAMLAGQELPSRAQISAVDMTTAATLPVRQLPPDVADFTGRSGQLAELVRLLSPVRGRAFVPVVVICGLPGVGKTTLALHVAHRLRRKFPDAQLYVQLDGTSGHPCDPRDVLGELLRALGVQPSAIPVGTNERSGALRSVLAGRKVLLVADDAATAAQVTPLLPGDAGCAVIVTSRTMLAAIPGVHLLRLDPLAPGEALEMLGRIAGPARVAAEPAASDQLIAACACLPLAVRIVGARLAARPSWPVARLTEMITDTRTRLSALRTTGLAARASFALSYDALPAAARRAFRLISLLGPSDFAEWPIAALLGESDAHEVTELLADKCMLTALGVDGTGQPRYHLHDLLRDYASEHLAVQADVDDGAVALERAITGWVELANQASRALRPDLYYPPLEQIPCNVVVPGDLAQRLVADPLAWFSAERANLIYMTERACSAGLLELANQLIAFQSTYQFYQGRFDEHERLLHFLDETARSASNERVIADIELRLAGLAAHRGDYQSAMAMFRRSLGVLATEGDPPILACGLYWYSYCLSKAGYLQMALEAARQALALARRLGDRETELMVLRVLGETYVQVGDHETALSVLEQAVTTSRKLADPCYEQFMLRVFAHVTIETQEWRRAIELCNQGLELTNQPGSANGRAHFLGLLGNAYNGLGRHDEAIRRLSDAVDIFRAHGDTRARARCMLSLARAHRALGQYQPATVCLRESLPIFHRLLLPSYERQALEELELCQAQDLSRVRRGPGPRPGSDR
jgi:DNA-binding SARP family transcriptional activator/tetratricopeptide (TPR) repeat protein